MVVAAAGVLIGVVINRLSLHQAVIGFEDDLRLGMENIAEDYATLFPDRSAATSNFRPSKTDKKIITGPLGCRKVLVSIRG